MRKDLAGRDFRFAGHSEFRPDVGHGCINIELAGFPERQDRGRSTSLGRRKHQLQRVLRPWLTLTMIGETTPEVNNDPAVDDHSTGCAGLAGRSKVLSESVANSGERFVASSADGADVKGTGW